MFLLDEFRQPQRWSLVQWQSWRSFALIGLEQIWWKTKRQLAEIWIYGWILHGVIFCRTQLRKLHKVLYNRENNCRDFRLLKNFCYLIHTKHVSKEIRLQQNTIHEIMLYIAGSSCGEYESNPECESATRRWNRKDRQGTDQTKKI